VPLTAASMVPNTVTPLLLPMVGRSPAAGAGDEAQPATAPSAVTRHKAKTSLFTGFSFRQLRCLPTIPAISNIVTWSLPNTGLSLASALMARLLAASCSPWALM
jgi:hypothetical protein